MKGYVGRSLGPPIAVHFESALEENSLILVPPSAPSFHFPRKKFTLGNEQFLITSRLELLLVGTGIVTFDKDNSHFDNYCFCRR